MQAFQIQVKDRRNGQFRDRTVVEAHSANAALRAYGIRGTRPRLGEATSKSGKRFKAIPVKG